MFVEGAGGWRFILLSVFKARGFWKQSGLPSDSRRGPWLVRPCLAGHRGDRDTADGALFRGAYDLRETFRRPDHVTVSVRYSGSLMKR